MMRNFVSCFVVLILLASPCVDSCTTGLNFSKIRHEFSNDLKLWCRTPLSYVQKYIPKECCVMDETSCNKVAKILEIAVKIASTNRATSICYQNIFSLFYYTCDCIGLMSNRYLPTSLCGVSDILDYNEDISIIPRIVGGQNAEKCEFPWMAKLDIKNIESCGASLVDANHVITAAHCTSRFTITDFIVMITSRDSLEPIFTRKVIKVNQHHRFKKTEDAFYNDISILQLSSPVKFSECVRPLCLPKLSHFQYDTNNCFATGWGRLKQNGPVTNILQKVPMPVLNSTSCLEHYPAIDARLSFCAGYRETGKDVCQGDSGGPLICPYQGKWYLAGITSFGRGCARKSDVSAFTNVTNYYSWIKEQID